MLVGAPANRGKNPSNRIYAAADWLLWSNAQLCTALKELYPREKTDAGNQVTSLLEEFKQIKLQLDPMQPSLVTTFTTAVYTLFDNHGVDLEILGMESSKPYIDNLKAKVKAPESVLASADSVSLATRSSSSFLGYVAAPA